MRCGKVDALVERYVDGSLPAESMDAVAAHARTCARCAARIAGARGVSQTLTAAAGPKAPPGFLDAVMDAVYREALHGGPRPAQSAPVRPAARGRVYRRLGYCMVFSAAVFAAAPLFPWQSARGASALSDGGAMVVKSALAGAGLTVQGVLHAKGGNTK